MLCAVWADTHTHTPHCTSAPPLCIHSVHIKACAVGLHVTADRCGDRGGGCQQQWHMSALLLMTWYSTTRAVSICMGTYVLIFLLSCLLSYLLTVLITFLITYFLTYFLNYLLTHLLTYLLSYSMQHSPSWEANRFSASQEIPRILWNPKVHYRIHKCPPPVPILMNSTQSIPSHPTSWRSILILSSHLRLGFPSGLFPSGFPTKTLYAPLLSPISATCLTHHIILNLITQIIFVRSTDH